MAKAKATTRGRSLPQPTAGGHPFPFEAHGLAEADRASHVWVAFIVPTSLYLDSGTVGGLGVKSGDTLLDFRHVVNPRGRCGMPVPMTGAEILDDDRGNYTYTSVSACMRYNADWAGRDYVMEALRAVNEVIVAYREVANRPTICTLGPWDLSQGLSIEGPFQNGRAFVRDGGIAGQYIAGTRSDGTRFLSAKGFVGGFGKLRALHGADVFAEIQEFCSGVKHVSAARRVFQEAQRELRHGDHGFSCVLGGSAIEIAIQEFLDRKGWPSGSQGTFANKNLVKPFADHGESGFDDVEPSRFALVERLYKVRNKVVHEGKAYFVDESTDPASHVVIGPNEVEQLLVAASAALSWIESRT
jgi:hypothetical protein